MKWENIKKIEKKILIISSIAILLTLIIGVSYAYIAYSTRQKGINVLETDCINVTMEELTNEIRLTNAYPVTDEVGANTKPFRFKLTNTCGVGVDYNLNLEVMGTENRIDAKNIAVKVDENGKSILNNNPSATPTYKESDYTAVESYTTYSGSIKPYDSVTHEVRIWLDASAGNDSQNGSFYSKVVIETRQNQMAAQSFADYILKDTSKSLEKFEHEETAQTIALTDYRYIGENPDNYVYFGCEGDACTEDNLYRIIGVIPTQSTIGGEYENRVKLIKANYYEGQVGIQNNSIYTLSKKGYFWNSSNSNKWEASSLNTQVLNNEYYNNLGKYQNFIVPSVWYLGAPKESGHSLAAKDLYKDERSNVSGKSAGNLAHINYIALLYPSDCSYAAGKNNINSNTVYSASSNWLFDNNQEWLLSPDAAYNGGTEGVGAWLREPYRVTIAGVSYSVRKYAIRPTFYLKFNVLYESGNGTQESPFRISINE